MQTAFKKYLHSLKLSATSRKLYLLDVARFLVWAGQNPSLDLLSSSTTYTKYLDSLRALATAPSMLKRTLASLRQFGTFLALTYNLDNPLSNSSLTASRTPDSLYQNYIKHFTNYLNSTHLSSLTIKSYKSDLTRYLDWATTSLPGAKVSQLLSEKNIKIYLNYLAETGNTLPSTIERKSKSISKFSTWYFISYPLESKTDSMKSTQITAFSSQNLDYSASLNPEIAANQLKTSKSSLFVKKIDSRNSLVRNFITLGILLLFISTLAFFGYRQFTSDAKLTQAYPSTPVTPNRQLSFQGRLENSAGTPITTTTPVTFKLWNQLSGGTESSCDGLNNCLYSTLSCSITPDSDGVFSTQIGSSCGTGIPSSVFSENSNIWLEVKVDTETLSPRQPIASVAYALNSETLQGLPIGTATSNIPYIDSANTISLTDSAPKLTGTTGTFQISAPALSFVTTSNGNINFSPNGTGAINVQGDTISTTSFFNISANQLNTGGTLIKGNANTSNTGFKLIDLYSGAAPTSKFSVTDAGNTTIAGDMTITGDDLIMGTNTSGMLLIADGTNYNPTAVSGDITINSSGTTAIGADKITEGMLKAVDAAGDEECLTYESTVGDFEWQTCSASTGDITAVGSMTTGDAFADATADDDWLGLGVAAGRIEFDDQAIDEVNILGANVGIGTATPGSYGAGYTTLAINGTTTGVTDWLANGVRTGTAYVTGGAFVIGSASTGNLQLLTNNSAKVTIVNTTGNMGVGTTGPDAKIDSLSTTEQLRLTYTDGAVYSSNTVDSSGNLTIDNTGTKTVIADDLQITGDDLIMGTNTSGMLLIADGTNYNPTAVSGDITINSSGTTAIGADKITEGMLKAVDAAGDEECLTYESTVGDFEWQTCSASTGDITAVGSMTTGDAFADATADDDWLGLGVAAGRIEFDDQAIDEVNILGANVGIGTATPTSLLHLEGAITGKALAIFNETGDQNIFTASQSGIPVFNLARVSGTAANGTTFTPGTTGNGVNQAATGSDTDIAMSLDAKGSGALNLNNTSTGDILIGGGVGSTGCTITNATGALACTVGISSSTTPFSGLTSSTNTSAAMLVGTGASLDFSGSGTINASTLLGGTWAIPGTIGSTTPNTAAFTTLTSSGNSTIGTGASSINTIGSVTTPGTLTLHGATTLDNTLTISGANLTSLGGDLTVTGTAWTATPTISGLITATSGLTASGTLTANGVFVLGDNGDLGSINTSDWDISTAGDMTGIGALTADGLLTLSNDATISGVLTLGNGTTNTIRSPYGPLNLAYKSGANAWTNGITLQDTTGNVGIGVAAPTQKLEVNGTIVAQKFQDASGGTYFLDPGDAGTSLAIQGDITNTDTTTANAFTIATTNNNNIVINAGTGTVEIGVGGAGKLDAGTIDPPYTINGNKYATYMASMTGVKEETTGTIRTSEYISNLGYRATLDLADSPTGSDVWLFSKASNLKVNLDKLVVLLSSSGNTKTWYDIDPQRGKLYLYSVSPTAISYRLTAPRFDSYSWLNERTSSSTGFIINDNDPWSVSEAIATIVESGKSQLNSLFGNLETNLISPLSKDAPITIAAPVVIAPIQGMDTPALIVEGTIDAATISARVAILSDIQAETITARNIVADTITANHIEGLDAKLATFSADLSDTEVESITTRIKDRLSALSGNLPTAQDIPTPIEATISAVIAPPTTIELESAVASDSAILSTLDADFVTINKYLAVIGSATITTLDVTNGFYTNTINSKTGLLALAENTLVIDANGVVTVNGDLTVSGKVLANSANLNTLAIGNPRPEQDTTLNQLLSIYNEDGIPVATIDASGSANLASLTTNMITIAAGTASASSFLSSEISTNATAGESMLVSPNTELTIESPYITSNSLVYLTPTGNTENKVLFVKSKSDTSFTVAIDTPATKDLSFNWWIIQVK